MHAAGVTYDNVIQIEIQSSYNHGATAHSEQAEWQAEYQAATMQTEVRDETEDTTHCVRFSEQNRKSPAFGVRFVKRGDGSGSMLSGPAVSRTSGLRRASTHENKHEIDRLIATWR
jgi:hypothetical protein